MEVYLTQVAETGIKLCEEGNWDEGLFCLSQISDLRTLDAHLIGRIYSYSGFGMAFRQNKVREGLELCEKAIRVEFFDPIHYYHLARTQLLAKRKRAALKTLEAGLKVDPDNKRLKDVRSWFGFRRPNVVPFLHREHPLNASLGRIRHKMLGPLVQIPESERQKLKKAPQRPAPPKRRAVKSASRKAETTTPT